MCIVLRDASGSWEPSWHKILYINQRPESMCVYGQEKFPLQQYNQFLLRAAHCLLLLKAEVQLLLTRSGVV